MRFTERPLWLVGFRPFFALACLAGLALPPLWVAMFAGAASPAPSFAVSPLHWHAHEMLYGFGWAMLGGFLLTASKNWVGIRGYHGLPLVLLTAAWLAERLLMASGAGLPRPLFLLLSSLFLAGMVGLLLATLIRHRASDSYRDNIYFILALPLFLPAKWLLLSEADFNQGWQMSVALFRLAFLIMFERTLTQFMKAAFQVQVLRAAWLDHTIKSLALLLVAGPWLPAPLTDVLSIALAVLALWRWCFWYPHKALTRIDIGIMYLGYLALALQALAEPLAGWLNLRWVGNVSAHLFGFGAMGLIIPAMIVRISRGHTGRKVAFDWLDKFALYLMLLGFLLRLLAPQLWPAAYLLWLLLAAACWCLCFGLLASRYIPLLLRPRADGKEH